MTRPEPLFGGERSKRKIMLKGTIIQSPNDIKRHSICEIHYFKEEGIKSAIDWLKEGFKRSYIQLTRVQRAKLDALTDKAFEDITNPQRIKHKGGR